MLSFPYIDPVAIHIGEFGIRWYSLAYIAGIMLGWWVVAREHKHRPVPNLSAKALDDMVMWAVLGIVLGGRLGYVLFYKPDYYFAHPNEIWQVWEGGMSFHGGLLGFIAAFALFCRKFRVHFLGMMDLMACAAPIGLFFGRIANFINGELWGRVTDSPLGMVFPRAGNLPRHPSQLYEAAMEGLFLFIVMMILLKATRAREKPGLLSGVFISGYAIARTIAEHFREPDEFLGYFLGFITMGQLLCLPMLAVGIYLICRKSPLPRAGEG